MTDLFRQWFPYRVPTSALGYVLLSFGGLELVYLVYWLLDVDGGGILLARDIGWLLVAAAAGAARVYFFHLSFHVQYARLLALAPWTPAKPLPIGPVHLSLQDLILVAIAVLTLHGSQISWVYFPLSFMLGYLVVSAWVLWRVETTHVWSLAVLFGVGLVVRLIPWPETAIAAAALTYEASVLGHEAWLSQFPRPFWPYEQQRTILLGWPWSLLNDKEDLDDELGTWRLVPSALMFGWFAYCFLALKFGHEPPNGQSLALCMLLLIPPLLAGAFVRFHRTLVRFAPPIDLWGRIWTLRWIIPGYDHIVLTPLATILLPPMLLQTLCHFECPVSIAGGLAIAFGGTILVAGPPSWRSFRLTGDHRMQPDFLRTQGPLSEI